MFNTTESHKADFHKTNFRKVMHVCLSSGWGGLEMYPARIIPELTRQGWEVHGLALEGSLVADSLRRAGIEPLTMSSRTRALLSVTSILSYLKAHDIRVLHCHKSSDLRLGALLVTLNSRLRLFFTDHMGVTRPKRDLYHRWAYGRVTRLFSISETTRQRNLAAFPLPSERIERLYLGIDTASYDTPLGPQEHEAFRAELGIPEGAVAIGLPGRITPGKGQRVFIDALVRLADIPSSQRWHALVIGGLTAEQGSHADLVAELRQRVAKAGLEQQVTFTGFRNDLPHCLNVLDIVCVPSRNEAFGLTVIEAMAASRPVIGANSGAIAELVNPTFGRLVDPDDANGWAHAMLELIQDANLRCQMGRAGQQQVARDFTQQRHVARLVEAYTEALLMP
ncbi:glycosyltransferase family 4 protein [Halomonas halocynthiae]|uniref:glycosyltransferase family 4 protein n=1 Tax=Halomonas halocynthiae TaxID=176290 RepID=UPI001F0B64ED|nr:glycosyltransferase family 4 protein [Halomonas halocynthiae]